MALSTAVLRLLHLRRTAQGRRHRRTASAASSPPAPLPDCWDLERVVLLAGFAFESYNTPVGGTPQKDASGGSTAFLSSFVREAYDGLLEVELLDASGLPPSDALGKSDPYVVLSCGDSAHTSAVRRFTLDPVWNGVSLRSWRTLWLADACHSQLAAETCRLLVRDASSSQLRARVVDEQLLGEHFTLGVAAVALAELADGQSRTLSLPVQGGGAGPGGGTLRLRLRFLAFAPPEAQAEEEARPWWQLGTLLSGLPRSLERRELERQLWAVDPGGEWALLARSPDARARPPTAGFEKLAFVNHERTDTQCALWRCRGSRTLVLAFRGTEQAKLTDLLTDARLMPRAFDPERGGGGGGDGPAAHDGFLEAWDAVRGRVLGLLDDARGAGPRAAALGRGGGGAWRLCVTGHSLGGALATLCALEVAASGRAGLSVSLVNFGSPRVGNTAFCELYNRLVPDSVRVVNGADAVPLGASPRLRRQLRARLTRRQCPRCWATDTCSTGFASPARARRRARRRRGRSGRRARAPRRRRAGAWRRWQSRRWRGRRRRGRWRRGRRRRRRLRWRR